MTGVFTGYAMIAFAIIVGLVLAKGGVVEQRDRLTLNKVAFYAASPALLFTVLAKADLQVVFTWTLATHALTAVTVWAIAFVSMRLLGTRDISQLMVGSYSAMYANANNIGLPVAVYVIGDGQLVASLLFLQLVILAPLLLGVLDAQASGKVNLRQIATQPFRNPIMLGSLLGAIVAFMQWEVPHPIMLPLELLGGASVPLLLMGFGISLVGQKPLQPGTGRRDVLVATALKMVVMPIVAWAVASFVFRMDAHLVYAATVLAALPTAQNMYQYSLQYRQGEVVARDTILLTTLLTLPVTFVVALLLHA